MADRPDELTPAGMLAATAADMRAVATGAAASPGATAYWACHPGMGAVGDHIAAWSPGMAEVIADWLETKAEKYGAMSASEQEAACVTADGTLPPMLKTCAKWWANRGVEPPVPA